jgi:symplekin
VEVDRGLAEYRYSKPDILKYLPRIVSILNGQQEPKNLVRSVFSSVVTTPPQTFGSVSSNLPRVRQSELLTPAELMVLLHEAEKEIGLKSAIEGDSDVLLAGRLLTCCGAAIGVCFSMTDVFRSEILAVVMQQIVDEPVLPVLFLRTVSESRYLRLQLLTVINGQTGHPGRHDV